MGASDPSRPGKNSAFLQVLLCTLVLGILAVALLTSSFSDVSSDAKAVPTAACTDQGGQPLSAEYPCGELETSRTKSSPASDQRPASPTTDDSQRNRPASSRMAELHNLRTSNGAARVKFSAACQSGDLKEDLRCVADRRQQKSGPEHMSGYVGPGAEAGLEISGRVMDEDGMGVAGITVAALRSRTFSREAVDTDESGPQPAPIRTTTDSLGSYRFSGLEDGEYDIVTEALAEYAAASTSVRAGISYADLILVREQVIDIVGRVEGTDGEPLEGVTVLPVVLGVGSVTTDTDGRYELSVKHDPRATSITLRFQLPGFDETYATVGGDRVAGHDKVEVDARMKPVDQWTTVSGVVTGSDGAVLAGHQVQLRPSGQMRIYQAITDGNGEFTFPAVEADIDYRLQVSGDPGYQDYDRRVTVTVDEAEFAIVVEPYEFGKLSGRMVNLDGSPVPDFNLLVKNAASARPNAVVKSDEDGNFTIENAPAGSLAFVSHSTPSVVVRGVQLAPGDAVHVPLVIDWGEHEIRGLVVDHRGNPVPASRVVLKWTHKDDGIRSSTIRRTAADAQGNFLFSQLGPGVHRLEIDAPGFGRIELDHDASREGYDVLVKLERPRKS